MHLVAMSQRIRMPLTFPIPMSSARERHSGSAFRRGPEDIEWTQILKDQKLGSGAAGRGELESDRRWCRQRSETLERTQMVAAREDS